MSFSCDRKRLYDTRERAVPAHTRRAHREDVMPERQLDKFRKVVKVKDGSLVILRPLVTGDRDRLVELFRTLDPEDLRGLKHDVQDQALVASWAEKLDYERVFPLVAQLDEELVADATLHRRPGTHQSHIGEVRIVIGSKMRGKGLGVIMLEEMITLAEKLGLEQLEAQVMIGSTIAQRAFEKVGFRQEAIFRDYFKTPQGRYYDAGVFFLLLKERWDEF
jgi:RimJ/RimL family protein N-acetyltransferase